MSIESIQALSMNSHFYSVLLQGFLSGYNKPCEMRLVFMALPILLHSESRKKLASAKSTSKMETLFNKPEKLNNDTKVSGKVKLAGYLSRFNELKPFSKKALVILYSKKKIVINEKKIILIEPIKYLDFDSSAREWIKAAHYLGVVFAKTNEDHLNYFLGVDRE
ncbi:MULTISPECIES: three component ABC system middle component [Bacillus]|uniref:DUF6521 family protein n=1 Tax=Bacillus rugosus TaxID=2715209 RepID=A0ACD4A0X5_9BACI|nr:MULTISPECIES: three component ABC system middle component [Bacillus]OBA09522.1 hypothetical protein A9D36_00095 [Bacillus subtilis]UPV79796.1 DUF6521 family protein [Bacillus rugosus]